MKAKIFYLCSFGFCFFFLLGCEKDDICIEDAATPMLIIRFLDYEDIEDYNAVPYLSVKATSEEENFITRVVTDSIAIPLNTAEESVQYEFIKNDPDPELEEDEEPLIPNSDIIEISYATEEEYLNRACGYVVNFIINDVTIETELASEEWIKDINIIDYNVEDENSAHIYIYH